MNKNYTIVTLPNNYYDYLVIMTSYENPLNFMDEILSKTNKENVKIIFDYSFVNDSSYSDYIDYDDSKSEDIFECFNIIDNIDKKLKAISKRFINNVVEPRMMYNIARNAMA